MSAGGDVRLVGLRKSYHDVVAVDGIDLEIPAGEFFTLVGPSGCGKTTTLRLIAGFERPTAGEILLDGEDMAHTPPHRRAVNTVFQSYALFTHKSVADNIAFGLKYQRCTKAEVARRVAAALDLVRLTGLDHRRPGQLSGGQQQRVALARALVLEAPVLLLDEPLGALDARLRIDLQVELKQIQERLGVTFVYVTHDQDEALTMSDRVAVMHGGRVEQCSDPQRLWEEPGTVFVADFLGVSNLIAADAVTGHGTDTRLRLGDFELRAETAWPSNGQGAVAMIRPERVKLEAHGATGENRLPGMVEEVVYLGFHRELRVRLATGALVKAYVDHEDASAEHRQGTPVAVHLPAAAVRVLAVPEPPE